MVIFFPLFIFPALTKIHVMLIEPLLLEDVLLYTLCVSSHTEYLFQAEL